MSSKNQKSQPNRKPIASVGKRYFAKRYHIQGYGTVEIGQEVTPEIMKLWKGINEPQTTD